MSDLSRETADRVPLAFEAEGSGRLEALDSLSEIASHDGPPAREEPAALGLVGQAVYNQ